MPLTCKLTCKPTCHAQIDPSLSPFVVTTTGPLPMSPAVLQLGSGIDAPHAVFEHGSEHGNAYGGEDDGVDGDELYDFDTEPLQPAESEEERAQAEAEATAEAEAAAAAATEDAMEAEMALAAENRAEADWSDAMVTALMETMNAVHPIDLSQRHADPGDESGQQKRADRAQAQTPEAGAAADALGDAGASLPPPLDVLTFVRVEEEAGRPEGIQIHNKAVFDLMNDVLHSMRPHKGKPPPPPWSKRKQTP